MNRAELILKNLIEKANEYSDIEFRLLLEKFLEREGKEGENSFVSALLNKKINLKIRLNLVRVAGYKRNPAFLIPLKTIAETETNINLQREAIIAISKYNDKKALNILSLLLEKNSNPELESVLKGEISKIKQNNPVLGLLPRLVSPDTDKKSLKNILSVLKRIVGPSEAKLFIPYLNIKDREILMAIYEILCNSADASLKNIIREKFNEFYESIPCKTHIKCDTLYNLFIPYSVYISKNPDKIFINDLKKLFNTSQDERIHELIIKLLASFPYREAMDVIAEIYEKKENYRETIIINLKGNEEGAELVINCFSGLNKSSSHSLKELMLKVLLSTEKGVFFLKDKFQQMSDIDKIIVLSNLSQQHYKAFRNHVLDAFTSDDIRIKKVAIRKFEENYDFSVEQLLKKEIIYASAHIEKDILNAIKKLFPVFLFYHLFYYLVEKKPSLKKSTDIINFVRDIAVFEPVLVSSKYGLSDYITRSFEIMSNNPNKSVLVPFFTIFSKIKFLEAETLKSIEEMFEKLIKARGDKLTSEEKLEIKRVKENFLYIRKDLKKINEGRKYLDIFYKNNESLENLIKIFTNYPLTAFLERKKIFNILSSKFETEGELYFKRYFSYFEAHRYITYSLFSNKKEKLLYFDKSKIKPQRIALVFKNRNLLPLLREQFLLFFDDLEFVFDNYDQNDLIVTDSQFYLSKKDEFNSKRKLIIILNDIKDSSMVDNKFAKMFLPEFSLYRILKSTIEELF